MLYTSLELENRAALDAAARICAAARTAPKTKGMDGLVTCVVTGEEKDRLSAQMRKLASELNYAFFSRDADNVDASAAVVLLAMHEKRRGLGAGCRGQSAPKKMVFVHGMRLILVSRLEAQRLQLPICALTAASCSRLAAQP